MEQLEKLETTVGGWFKDLPRLPKEFTRWLADNLWWLTIIGIVLSIFAVLAALAILLAAFGLTGLALSGVPGAYSGYAAVSAVAGVAMLGVIVSVIGFVVTTILMVLAINPLKEKKKRGWTLLFAVLLLSFAVAVVSNVITFNLVGVLLAAFWAAVEAYILFEIRSYFGVKHKAESAKPSPKKA